MRNASALAILFCAFLLGLAQARPGPKPKPAHDHVSCRDSYLYVWAGGDAVHSNDTLFVMSVKGPSFGKIVHVVETPYQKLEPHHCGISADGKWLGAGGLLSVLSGNPETLFFDIKTNPKHPKLVRGIAQPKKSAITDEFLPTPDGGFLVSMMGSASGGSPGRVVRYDSKLKLVGEYPEDDSTLDTYPGFNPHGMDVDWERGTMCTADFVEPASTLNAVPGGPVLRTTVRLWDLETMTIQQVFDAADTRAQGMMDAKLIGNTGKYYFTGGNGKIYLLDPTADVPELVPVFDLYSLGPDNSPMVNGLMYVFRKGTRMLITSFGAAKVYLFDCTVPEAPVFLNEQKFPAGAGAHYVLASSDESIVAVLTYFLDEGAIGKVHAAGDKSLRFFSLNECATKLTPHPTVPVVDFKTILPGKGEFAPHAIAFSHV